MYIDFVLQKEIKKGYGVISLLDAEMNPLRGLDLNTKFSNYSIAIKNINKLANSWYKPLINDVGKLFYALNFFRFLFNMVLASFSPY